MKPDSLNSKTNSLGEAEFYKKVFQQSPDAIALLNCDGEIVKVNKSFKKIFGYDNNELAGKDISIIFDSNVASSIIMRMERDTKLTERLSAYDANKNKILVDFYAEKTTLPGSSCTIICFIKDVSAESKTRQMYQQLVENSLQGVVVIQDLRIVYTNAAFSKITGYSIDELLSFIPPDTINLVHPDDRERVWGNLRRRLAGENIPQHYQFKGLSKDGQIKTLDLYAAKIEYNGKPAIQGLILDVSEIKKTQEKLEQRNKFIETILNNIPIGIAVNEIDTGLSNFMNDEFETIYGWTEKELKDLKQFYKKIIPDPEARKILSNKIKTDIKRKKPEDLFWDSVEISSKNGDKKYVLAKNIPLYDQNLMIHTVQDITEQIKAEMQIQHSLKEKEILLREIHHRVKNNLQTISSLLDLQSENIKDKNILNVFKSSQSRIRSMALIHERLYKSENLSRIKAREYINSLIDHLESTYIIKTESVKIHKDISNIYLNLDVAIPCGLIINELVSNSMKYAFPKNRAGSISVALKVHDEKHLTLIVEDTGIGIPSEINFKDLSSLGLQLVDLLCKQLSGNLSVNKSGGTSFKITFPSPTIVEEVNGNR